MEDFLDPFIQELTSLNENGIELNGKHRDIATRAFLCDSPARSFLKCVQNHTGYNACERLAVFSKLFYTKNNKKVSVDNNKYVVRKTNLVYFL